jgi:hypothetical protein
MVNVIDTENRCLSVDRREVWEVQEDSIVSFRHKEQIIERICKELQWNKDEDVRKWEGSSKAYTHTQIE